MIPLSNRIKSLPKGLSVQQAARRLRRSYHTTRYWLVKRGYHRVDGRAAGWSRSRWLMSATVDPDKVDWTMRDAQIARKFGVSRQRIGQLRRIHKRKNGK